MEKNRAPETILTISLGFLGLFLVFMWIKEAAHYWMLYTSFAVGVLGLASRWIRESIHTSWFWLADKMGFVMSRIVLSLVFIFVVLPFGFVAKLFRKDLMFLKKGRRTYYKTRNHGYTIGDLENPW